MEFKSYQALSNSLTPEQREEIEREIAECKAKIPECLRNLVWEGGEMYYVDDNCQRIDKELDHNAITTELIRAMPKSPIIVNGEETDRTELLKKVLKDEIS